ncbi:MAG: outer membrane protein assembly factor BamB family protein [Planctomycetota bacterium]|jgi:hypothetical protein
MLKTLACFLATTHAAVAVAQHEATTYGTRHGEMGICADAYPDGGLIISGYTFDSLTNESNTWDSMLVRTNADGTLRWSTTFGGPGMDFAWSVRTMGEGSVVAGTRSVGAGEDEGYPYAARINADGDTIWKRTFDQNGFGIGWGVQPLQNGSMVIVTQHTKDDGDIDAVLYCLNESGETMWTHRVEGTPIDRLFSPTELTNGDVVVVGFAGTDRHSDMDFLQVRVSPEGERVHTLIEDRTRFDVCHDVRATDDGGYIVIGYMDVNEEGPTNHTPWAARYSADNELLWEQSYPSDASERYWHFQLMGDTILGSGGVFDAMTRTQRMLILAIDAENGSVVSREHYGENMELGRYVTKLPDGSAAVIGAKRLERKGDDLLVLRVGGE